VSEVVVFPDFVRAAIPLDRTDNRMPSEWRVRASPRGLHLLCSALSKPDPLQVGVTASETETELVLGEINYPVILVCSHNSRDKRCGIMGPALLTQFRQVLEEWAVDSLPVGDKWHFASDRVNVGAISHIGGHVYAGNVIIYVPRTWKSPLAGCGIWFGFVEPKHVEGLIRETLKEGRIVQELFRGGIDSEGNSLRLPVELEDRRVTWEPKSSRS
jgi:(2Fe-2S) ferredoxin